MYTIMIVDDEKIIGESLKSKISRMDNIDIGNIILAFSGAEAIKFASEIGPDIIITDIRMPEMNGIELIKEISSFDMHTKFMVLSGYDDYQFVREAFKLGVFDYILKPVGINELKERLESIIAQIKAVKAKEQLNTSEDKKKQEYILETILTKLFGYSYISEAKAEELIEELEIFLPHKYLLSGMISFDHNMDFYIDNDFILRTLSQKAEQCMGNTEIQIVGIEDHMQNQIVIFNFNRAEQYNILITILEDLLDEVKEKYNTPIIAALSNVSDTIKMVKTLQKQAVTALSYKVVYENYSIIRYETIKDNTSELVIPRKELDDFISNLDSVTISKLSEYIDSWFCKNKMKNLAVESIAHLYDIVLQRIMGFADSHQIILAEGGHRDFFSFFSINDMKCYLKNYIFEIASRLSDIRNKNKTVVDIAKRYIEENYSNDISMAIIANTISMSYTYFSKLFKEQTDATFSEYLTKVRMEEAKKFLKDPIIRINEISAKVGYSNQYHFSRAFKNHFGISPKKFRAMNNQAIP